MCLFDESLHVETIANGLLFYHPPSKQLQEEISENVEVSFQMLEQKGVQAKYGR